MLHTRIARAWRGASVVTLALACHAADDPTSSGEWNPPAPAANPTVALVDPPLGDTLWQRSVQLDATVDAASRLAVVELIVDPGTANERVSLLVRSASTAQPRTARFWHDGVLAGSHTFGVRVIDNAGRMGERTVTRVFALGTTPYAALALPTLGGDAEALGVNARGEAVGWAINAAGVKRPVVWRNGGIAEVPNVADTVPAIATRINDAGDILLAASPIPRPRVLRADGQVVPLATDSACCTEGIDLNDRRVALVLGARGLVFVDLVRGTSVAVDIPSLGPSSAPENVTAIALNDRGDALVQRRLQFGGGTRSWSFYLYTPDRIMPGIVPAPTLDPSPCSSACDQAVGLTNAGAVVVEQALGGRVYFAPADSTPVVLHPYFGPHVARVRVNREGTTLVGLDGADSTLYLLRRADWRASRVVAPGWTFDRISAISNTGVIIAHGRSGNGALGPVLLRPTP